VVRQLIIRKNGSGYDIASHVFENSLHVVEDQKQRDPGSRKPYFFQDLALNKIQKIVTWETSTAGA
jgi:hypothetical protein